MDPNVTRDDPFVGVEAPVTTTRALARTQQSDPTQLPSVGPGT
jgi:hypothetical protein